MQLLPSLSVPVSGARGLNKETRLVTKEQINDIAEEAAESTVRALSGKFMEQPKEESAEPVEEEQEEEDEPCECGNLKPMELWLGEEDKEGAECHECLARPIAEYYLGALEQAKAEAQAKELEEAWATEDLIVIGKAMDKIKSEVAEPLKKRLLTYDCYAQTYKPEAEDEALS